jgi:predicted dehydrogenase
MVPVKWVIDREPARLKTMAERFPSVRTSTELSAVLSDPEVSAVLIATPTSTHAALATQALEHGKHVFVEKPLATSVADGLRLQALAEARGKVLMVGHIFLFNDAVSEVGRRVRDGELGALRLITMTRTNLGPVRPDVDAAVDLASHDFSIADAWVGASPLTVSAVGGAWLSPTTPDAVFATVRYPGAVLVNVRVSWLHPTKSREITVIGERGMITFDDLQQASPLTVYHRSISASGQVRDEGLTSPQPSRPAEPLSAELRHFFQCVAQGRAPLTGAAQALSVLRTLEAVQQSMRLGGAQVEIAQV